MKKSIILARRIRYQRGFSVLEILIATVLISLLIASGLYYANVGDKADIVDVTASKAAIAVRFPEALLSVYAKQQTFTGTTLDDLVKTGSVRAGSPVVWSIASGDDAPKDDTLKVRLTFDSDSEAGVLKTYLDNNKDAMMVSDITTDTEDEKTLVITYEIK